MAIFPGKRFVYLRSAVGRMESSRTVEPVYDFPSDANQERHAA